jgi:outer membrane protein TolC
MKFLLTKKIISIIFILALLFTGCNTTSLKKSADREVYKILKTKTEKVKAEEKAPLKNKSEPKKDSTPIHLNLKDALLVAAKNNRDYQSQKESLYLKTLDLTYQRYQYRSKYTLSGGVSWNKNGDESVDADLNLNLVKWLADGATATFSLGKDFLKYLTGSKEKSFQTALSFNLLQPLFKGSGRKIAQENLVQAERNIIYQIRSFLRYQRKFSVDTTKKYFSLLETKNSLINYKNNYESSKQTRGRLEMLEKAGREKAVDVDQARQREYAARQSLISAENRYKNSLDQFKIFLGLSPQKDILLDKEGLPEITEVNEESKKFIKFALEKRLDLISAYDQVEDTKRGLTIALDNLKNTLNLNLNIASSSPEKSHPTLDFEDPSYSAGLDYNFPLNKTPERNSYKSALISLERKKRGFIEKSDNIELEVRTAHRAFKEAHKTYLIQKKSLELAKKRVESANMLLQAGRTTTRDLLEAQDAYLNAGNSLAGAIVDYLISYLDFLKVSELLKINEKGIWQGDIYEKISGQNHKK